MGFFDNLARWSGLRQAEITEKENDLITCNKRVQVEVEGGRELQRRIELCKKDDVERANEIINLENVNKAIVQNLADCRAKTFDNSGIPLAVQEVIKKSYTHYPEADISYNGLYVGNDPNKRVVLDVRTWALCGQNDYKLEAFIKGSGIHISDYMKQTNDFHKACDIAAMRVAEKLTIKYVTDYKNYNVDEYWQWAPVTFSTGQGDCDDWGFLRHAAFRIAGIPEGLLRLTAGNTRYGEGHLTNYYRDSTGIWRHINSTTSFPIHNSVTEFPAQNDSSDQMGVTDAVWFSFNAEKAFHQFSTASAEESFKKGDNQSRLLRYIQIKPKVS